MLTAGKDTDWVNIPLAVCARGNCLDAFYTLKVYEVLRNKLEELNMINLYENILSPASPIFTEIELEGLLIDLDILERLNKDISGEIFECEEKLYSYPEVDKMSNLRSTHDIIKILYSSEKDKEGNWNINEKVGFGLYPTGRTDKGQPSTNEDELNLLYDFISLEIGKRGLSVETK